jgi:hypothetical protein
MVRLDTSTVRRDNSREVDRIDAGFVMDRLNVVGSVASLIGLAVSIYTLYKVETLTSALRRQSRDQQLTELIDKIVRSTSSKAAISEPTARELEFLIKAIRSYYVSSLSFRHRQLKFQRTILEEELSGQRRREIVQNQVQLIRHEIAIR